MFVDGGPEQVDKQHHSSSFQFLHFLFVQLVARTPCALVHVASIIVKQQTARRQSLTHDFRQFAGKNEKTYSQVPYSYKPHCQDLKTTKIVRQFFSTF